VLHLVLCIIAHCLVFMHCTIVPLHHCTLLLAAECEWGVRQHGHAAHTTRDTHSMDAAVIIGDYTFQSQKEVPV
jgi:hypothetical protein